MGRYIKRGRIINSSWFPERFISQTKAALKDIKRRISKMKRDIQLITSFWKESNFFPGKKLLKKTRILLQCHEALLQLPEVYQPVVVPGLSYLRPKRPCEDRLELIMSDLDDRGARINDIGCQIGFFSFSLASKGYSVTGYDMETRNISICHRLNELKEISLKPKFFNIKLDLETIDNFELVDYTLCLAVFHHIIHYRGLVVAKKLIALLRKKIEKKIYFEVGQSNEPVEPWANSLPDMGIDPFMWIAEFLKEGGFKNIKSLGKVVTHVSEIPRYLVVAE